MKRLRKYSILFLALFFLYISGEIHTSNQKPQLIKNKQDSAINIHSKLLNIFSLGQRRLLSDLVWISTLLESDLEHYNKKDSNSWMFHRFNSISALDPLFLRNYQFGGKYLSIIKDDLVGAEKILLKGLKNFPNDYSLISDTAFLYGFELLNYSEALGYYKKMLTFSESPKYIKSLVHKFEYKVNPDLADIFKLVLETYHKEPKGTFLKSKLHSDLYSIKAQIDLECLNSDNHNCEKKDFEGYDYIKKSNSLHGARKSFKKYKLNKKGPSGP